jgi:hypothetical protein
MNMTQFIQISLPGDGRTRFSAVAVTEINDFKHFDKAEAERVTNEYFQA